MSDPLEPIIHASARPEALRTAAVAALRRREVPHALHYQSDRQAARWLAVHRAYSPWVRDENCRAFYRAAFTELAARFIGRDCGLLSLGCGSGEKDALLLGALRAVGASTSYRAHDVSPALVQAASDIARPVAARVLPPVVAALEAAPTLRSMLSDGFASEATLLTLMLGLSPNFAPKEFFEVVVAMAERGPVLLSANLAPGADYAAGLAAVLPQYDNAPTREWLSGTLSDLGFSATDGALEFSVGTGDGVPGVRCIEASFHLAHDRELEILGEHLSLRAGESLRVFFSYRYTPALMAASLQRHDLRLAAQWVSPGGEEGLFLADRA